MAIVQEAVDHLLDTLLALLVKEGAIIFGWEVLRRLPVFWGGRAVGQIASASAFGVGVGVTYELFLT